jgi:hypothetical protein
MADEKVNKSKENNLAKQSSIAVFGVDDELDEQSKNLRDVIKQTIIDTSEYVGNRAKGKPVNYFSEINFGNAFAELRKDPEKRGRGNTGKTDPARDFKKYMSEQDFGNISGILMQESGRIIGYSNYKAIYNHIPEAAQALDMFKDNIMSPDDFTKLIFNIDYKNDINPELRKQVQGQFKDLISKYNFEELAEEIIEGSLLYGDQYVAILSLEEDLNLMLTDPINNNGVLNEKNIGMYDLESVDIEVNRDDVDPIDTGALLETFGEALSLTEDTSKYLDEKVARQLVANMVNQNVHIGSKKELILERISAEYSNKEEKKSFDLPTSKKKKGKKNDEEPMYINGSSIRILDPSKVVELKIDNVVYGYYLIENANIGNVPNAGYLGSSTGREVLNPVNMGSNIITTNNSKFTQHFDKVSATGLSDQKVDLISRIFLDTLSKKVNKDFIRHNKEFKDFIYNLVKQDYILKKQIRITYFAPNEVVAFKIPALYRKITFFAKLYLSMLTNMLLIKMGRAHDKRVFYIDVGVDANYEQAISRVIQDIKTKEFKMDTIGDINTVLNLNPGRFDDYYIPTVNGEKPIEIDTLQGMDVEMNNDFIEFLKDSMMSGMGVPRTLIDATKELDFARTLSAQNANFVRSVVKYQKRLTEPFNKLFKILYGNEYKFYNDGESKISGVVNFDDISVSFPSPATLNMSNITDQIQAVDGNAEFISTTLVPADPTGNSDKLKSLLKKEIVKDLLPAVDWNRYEEYLERAKIEKIKNDIKEPKIDDGLGPM